MGNKIKLAMNVTRIINIFLAISVQNFVNVDDLTLHHGKRYKVCIHANSTNKTHETWTETIDGVSACSDGIVVDITPPVVGQVWIGWHEHLQFQVIMA